MRTRIKRKIRKPIKILSTYKKGDKVLIKFYD